MHMLDDHNGFGAIVTFVIAGILMAIFLLAIPSQTYEERVLDTAFNRDSNGILITYFIDEDESIKKLNTVVSVPDSFVVIKKVPQYGKFIKIDTSIKYEIQRK